MTNWMLSYVATLGACYTLSMEGILCYFGTGAKEKEQSREHLQTCQQVLLASERYDGPTVQMFCGNSCLRDNLIQLRKELNGENIEMVVKETYRKCGE